MLKRMSSGLSHFYDDCTDLVYYHGAKDSQRENRRAGALYVLLLVAFVFGIVLGVQSERSRKGPPANPDELFNSRERP